MRSIGATLFLSVVAACAADGDPAATSAALTFTVPPGIAVPPGQHVTLEAHAFGFQIYECKAGAWTFRAPAALLFDDEGELVASHFGGIDVGLPAGAYWQSTRDGSRVHGGDALVSPNPPNIPELRLTALDTAGDGIFTPTTFIHRLATVGGAAPTGSCRIPGSRLPVFYQADYVTYAAGLPRPVVPTTIAVDEAHNLAHEFHAEGVQIYQCTAAGWAFRAPRATLFDDDGDVVVKHFGGIDVGLPAGAYWESTRDGSRVHAGNAVASPNPGAIPELRLETLDTAGTGILSRVSFVQRLATVGGVGPTGACAPLDTKVEVPYTSEYLFYIPVAD